MWGLDLTPLAWGFGMGIGCGVALLLGPTVPQWGMCLAFPATLLLLSAGALREDDGDELRHLLRFAVALSVAFLAVSVPWTWWTLKTVLAQDIGQARAAHLARVGGELLVRWLVIALPLPGTLAALWLRRHRERSRVPL